MPCLCPRLLWVLSYTKIYSRSCYGAGLHASLPFLRLFIHKALKHTNLKPSNVLQSSGVSCFNTEEQTENISLSICDVSFHSCFPAMSASCSTSLRKYLSQKRNAKIFLVFLSLTQLACVGLEFILLKTEGVTEYTSRTLKPSYLIVQENNCNTHQEQWFSY